MEESPYATREQTRKMAFLACVINESLRLYPPVSLNNHGDVVTTVLPIDGGSNVDRLIFATKSELVVFRQHVNSRKKAIYGQDADNFCLRGEKQEN
ncbi:hypothetical protein BKA67DRAFT_656038 [Truncatella angustata]|uniref:Uncharacterized protein n=1 Tax=Truncatella angustata TaxID=152316 RepID=A0A9P8UTB6_9PEZI|nr:uncharacterized protein BKA67DRAFT_656038 [Truncatella angustata]KAH6657796.1 hypothetical protein BKA67DRAFT_656038 [Truncatella angustata]